MGLASGLAVVACGGSPAAPSKANLQEQGTLKVTCGDDGCIWSVQLKNIGTACATDIGGTATFMDGNRTIVYTSDIATGTGPVGPGAYFGVMGPSNHRGPQVLLDVKDHKLDLTWKDVRCQCAPGAPCVIL
jgi:hypothetical protein